MLTTLPQCCAAEPTSSVGVSSLLTPLVFQTPVQRLPLHWEDWQRCAAQFNCWSRLLFQVGSGPGIVDDLSLSLSLCVRCAWERKQSQANWHGTSQLTGVSAAPSITMTLESLSCSVLIGQSSLFYGAVGWFSEFINNFKFAELYSRVTMSDTAEIQASGENTENIPEIELIIKASTIDGRRKGACLFCQVHWSFWTSGS